MSESSSGVPNVRIEIATVAGPREWGDTRESWLARVPRKVPTVSVRTVRALWNGEIRNPDNHWAARDIRRAAELIAARQEASALASQFTTIARGLRVTDQIFFSAQIDRLEQLVRQLGPQDSPGNRE